MGILKRQFKFFGPFPPGYRELIDGNKDLDMVIQYLFEKVPERNLFSRVAESEVLRRDKEFICKIMKLDPRERPTVKEPLHDDWFREENEG